MMQSTLQIEIDRMNKLNKAHHNWICINFVFSVPAVIYLLKYVTIHIMKTESVLMTIHKQNIHISIDINGLVVFQNTAGKGKQGDCNNTSITKVIDESAFGLFRSI